MKRILEKKEISQTHVSDIISVLHDNTQRIMPNISAIPPPPVQSLVETDQSRCNVELISNPLNWRERTHK